VEVVAVVLLPDHDHQNEMMPQQCVLVAEEGLKKKIRKMSDTKILKKTKNHYHT
jgi:hypothetical protein